MRIAYFDCFCGAAGDMILAAMLDAGLPAELLRSLPNRLGLVGVQVDAEKISKQGFSATQLTIHCDHASQPGRHLADIRRLIVDSSLSDRVKDSALRIFGRLAEAEARAHGTGVEQVHFHEVGAVDAIVDVVGACFGLETLAIGRIVCSPIPAGSGTVQCAHGTLPVPAPATLALLEGVPLAQCDEPGELTTPTGAAILTTLADEYGAIPPMRVEAAGYGAGSREGRTRPNLHRLILGKAETPGSVDEVVQLQANLDDATGQVVAHATERLLEAGALDVFTTPIGMKKGRPATMVTVLARPEDADALEEILFAETTTFGVRRWIARRAKLERRWQEVSTPWGPVRIKLGLRSGRCITATPEYDDCHKLAADRGVPLRVVLERVQQVVEVLRAATEQQKG
ncbi:MAG: nickel pincer cofactor biosynthesis protein LarC [Phycisphaerales bacterium]|nr:MAG: nickel pincer cofactor biosynthesis protein LarC [Phycisphaerales bacterium]